MEEALLFVEQYQAWLYVLLVLAGLIYLRQTLRGLGELRRALFGLERERALEKVTRSGAMLGLSLALLVAVFVVATYVGPAVPASARPTPVPTVSLLSVPTFPAPTGEGAFATATPLPAVSVDTSGCQNPQATITSPKDGDSISGTVDITGTADIPNFAFYKFEYISLTPGSVWRAIQAGTESKRDESLGPWDTSLVLPGDYALRLVVSDTNGNAPMPCVIRIRVLPSG
jgi:hypothetical protein